MQDFSVTVSDFDGRVELGITGELDFYSAPKLDGYLAALSGDTHLSFYLAGLTFIDSEGLGVLLGAYKRAHAHGRTMTLRAVPAHVQKVFEITGLWTMLAHPD